MNIHISSSIIAKMSCCARGVLSHESRRSFAAALALAACLGPAAAVDFPATGGNRDLADSAAWGGTPPASTDDVTFKQGGTFTASGNMSFRTVTVDAYSKETAFDFRSKNAKLTLTGGSGTYGLTYSANNFQRIRMYGGVWDFNGAMFRNGHAGTGGHINMFLHSGVVVTNVSTFYWAKHAQPGSGYTYTCNIQDGSKVHTTGDLLNYATGWDAQLNISGGSKVTVGGLLYSDQFGVASDTTGRHKITVTGAGTLLELKGEGQHYIGHTHRCNSLTVADHARIVATAAPIWLGDNAAAVSNALVVTGGASANLGTTYVGHGNNTFGNHYIVSGGAHATNSFLVVGGNNVSSDLSLHDNFLEVADAELYVQNWTALGNPGMDGRMTVKAGGVFSTPSLYVGSYRGTASSGNVFEALEGSHVTVRGTVTVGTCGDNNGLVVSNASFTAGNLTVGAAGRRGSSVHIYGPGCDFTLAGNAGQDWDVFGATRDGLVEFRDGAVFDVHDTYIRLGSYATNCTLRITGGSYLYATNNTSSLGRNQCLSLSNRVEVLDESHAKVVRWRLTTEAGCTVLSNSTFETTHGDGFIVGYKETASWGVQTNLVADNRFEMQGDHPKAKTPGQFTLANKSTLHLLVPPTGYARGHVLIESGTFKINDASSRLTVDMDEYYNKVGGRILVARTTNGVTLNATALAASNALLPSDCSFSVSTDGNELYLNVPSRRGTWIVIR